MWVGWSTGNGTIYPNQQAPYYPNATLYAPQTPDPASYSATVSHPMPASAPHLSQAAQLLPVGPSCCSVWHVPGVHAWGSSAIKAVLSKQCFQSSVHADGMLLVPAGAVGAEAGWPIPQCGCREVQGLC